jgi:type IV pilus assembly protein PilM
MQKILGLDIGTYSIKAVILWNDYKNYRVHQLLEQKIEYKEGVSEKAAQTAAIDALLQQNQLEFDVVYAALDSRNVSIRKVDFENIRKRDIPGFLENELESSSPFAIEDSILDYQIIEFAKSRSSVLAVLCKKEVIKNILDIIEQEHLRVKVLDVDNLTYLNMVSYLVKDTHSLLDDNDIEEIDTIKQSPSCSLIINIGHSKTTLTFMADKKVLYTRIISIAGDYFNQILKQQFELDYQDAEILKCFVGSMLMDPSEGEDSKRNLVASVLSQAISELSGEVLRTIQSFQAKENIKIKSLYLTGGSSKIRGIQKYFESSLKTSVSNVSLKKENFIFEDDEFSDNANEASMAVYSQTLAISMRGLQVIGVTSKINLRKGEFAQASNYDKLIRQILLYSSATAIVLFCLLLSYFFRSFMYNNEIDTLKNQFRKEVISMFAGEPYNLRVISSKKDWDFRGYGDEAIALLKQSMKDKKALLENYSSIEPSLPLKIINQVSQAVPKNIYFEVSEFRVQDNQLYLEAETNNSDNIAKIIEKMSKIKSLNQVTKKSQSNKVGSEKKLIHFSLVASITNGEG